VNTLDGAILRAIFGRIRLGELQMTMPDGTVERFRGRMPGPSASIDLHHTLLLRRLVTLGAIGLADGYIAGDFDSPDLASLIELATLHLEPSAALRIPAPLDRSWRALWRVLGDTAAPRGPLRDIVHHYDLGNEFYGVWLDPTMTYSSAVFADGSMSLEDAQREKNRRLAEAMGIQPGDRVLEIGSGWGGFAAYAAGSLGANVTTVTTSREQHDYVRKMIADQGLTNLVDARLQDFEVVRGTFDKVVSIEMIESIPQRRWDPYFRVLADRTRPGGTIGLQIIVVADRHWRTSNENPDFIRRYVFPGGQVPAPMILRDLARRHGLRWIEDHGYGASYARTLAAWLENFDHGWPRIAAMGFDEPFRRMWRYYLSYTQGGFRAGRVDVRQIVLRA